MKAVQPSRLGTPKRDCDWSWAENWRAAGFQTAWDLTAVEMNLPVGSVIRKTASSKEGRRIEIWLPGDEAPFEEILVVVE